MIRKLLFTILICTPILSFTQISFTNSSSSLNNSTLKSGVAIGVSDMNNDGLDDIIRLSNASHLEIEYQTASGTFTNYTFGAVGGSQWGLCIADVDKNGFNDVFAGGAYNGLKLLTANSTGTALSATTLSSPNIFLQNANFADIDNNGTIDIFACHDNGISSPYSNNGSGSMTYNLNLINTQSTIPSDNSGNYGSIWADYDNDGDQDLYISKCRLGVGNPLDGRRVNLLFQNDGNGNFTDVAEAAGLRPLAQSWSASFEDIDNDGDLDCFIINHNVRSNLFLNNGNGTFTDITNSSGMSAKLDTYGLGIQIIMEDFDNDTFIDIFLTARNGEHVLFLNDGDNTFTETTSPFPTGGTTIQSAAVGDLNNDGFIDVIAGFATGYNSPSSTNSDMLFINNGNLNNWSELRLQGVLSNINGIGARVEIHYGTNQKQIREVRSGESYGNMNSLMTHFGLGTYTSITKIVVKWPSGTVDELINPSINQSILLIEGSNTLSTTDYDSSVFKVFPNPSSDYITISHNENDSNIAFQIIDLTGKVLLEDSISNKTHKIDTTPLHSGLYFIRLTSASNYERLIKFIKE